VLNDLLLREARRERCGVASACSPAAVSVRFRVSRCRWRRKGAISSTRQDVLRHAGQWCASSTATAKRQEPPQRRGSISSSHRMVWALPVDVEAVFVKIEAEAGRGAAARAGLRPLAAYQPGPAAAARGRLHAEVAPTGLPPAGCHPIRGAEPRRGYRLVTAGTPAERDITGAAAAASPLLSLCENLRQRHGSRDH